MQQTCHRIGFIAFGQRGQQLAETLINQLPEYGYPAAVVDLRERPVVSPLFPSAVRISHTSRITAIC